MRSLALLVGTEGNTTSATAVDKHFTILQREGGWRESIRKTMVS